MLPTNWQIAFDSEITQAEAARARGNEGMGRVCARRAAGIVVGEYFRRQQIPFNSPSAIERLRHLLAQPALDPQLQAVAGHFLMHLNPDHTLPVDADLLAEARWFAAALLGDPAAS